MYSSPEDTIPLGAANDNNCLTAEIKDIPAGSPSSELAVPCITLAVCQIIIIDMRFGNKRNLAYPWFIQGKEDDKG